MILLNGSEIIENVRIDKNDGVNIPNPSPLYQCVDKSCKYYNVSLSVKSIFCNICPSKMKVEQSRKYISTVIPFIDIPNLKVELLGPTKDNYQETNEYSIITRIQYFEEVYIFMGDAHTSNENEILRYYGFDYINADVVKVGHHGSSSSSS